MPLYDLLDHVRVHMLLAATALGCALAIAIPAGAYIALHDRIRQPVLTVFNLARVIPSLALLALMIPYLGVGSKPAIVALAILAIPPIAINTDLGIRSVSAAVLDAARGMGMDGAQINRRVRWPLAFPVVFTGVRTAANEVIASATLAAFIGGGGLGEYIVEGLADNDQNKLLLGALSVAALALLVEISLAFAGRRIGAYQ